MELDNILQEKGAIRLKTENLLDALGSIKHFNIKNIIIFGEKEEIINGFKINKTNIVGKNYQYIIIRKDLIELIIGFDAPIISLTKEE